MAKVLTPAVVREYIAKGGNYCPYCDSKFIDAREVDADGPSIKQEVVCDTCGEIWDDVYFLGAADVHDENGKYVDTIEPAPEIPDMILLAELIDAAEAHGGEESTETQVGDLEEMLVSAWSFLTKEQRTAFFKMPAIVDLLETPEYEEIAREIAGNISPEDDGNATQ